MISPPEHSPFEFARSVIFSHVRASIRRAVSGTVFVMEISLR